MVLATRPRLLKCVMRLRGAKVFESDPAAIDWIALAHVRDWKIKFRIFEGSLTVSLAIGGHQYRLVCDSIKRFYFDGNSLMYRHRNDVPEILIP